jgi:TolB-like protein/DNA-binding winged helix-turn-helix (wHTH) protein/Tfp pilus assembly protein PilF
VSEGTGTEHAPLRVGAWRVLPLEGRIVRDDKEVRVRPKAMDVLLALARSPGRVVERETLLAEVWGRAVSDEPLTAAVAELRRALGDRRADPAYIETVPKRGYRLVAEVERLEEATATDGPAVETASAAGVAAAPSTDGRRHRSTLVALALGALLLGVSLLLWLPAAPPPPGRALAVLPFTHPGSEADAYFATGLADELRTLFTRIGALQVAAPASVARIAERREDLEAVRTELGVDTVLDGSIRRDGERVRITAQLVDARTGFQLWAGSFDRGPADLLDVQREIADAIVRTLRIELLGPEQAALARGVEADPAAYDLYLRARFAEEERTAEGFERAAALYEAALERAPGFALAHAGLAKTRSQQADLSFLPAAEAYGAAEAAAERARALDPDLGEAHHVLGWVALYHRRDFRAAEESLDRALTLRPGDATIVSAHAALELALGRPTLAVAGLQRAARLDPLNPGVRYNLAYFAFLAGELALADAALDRLLADAPEYLGAHMVRAQVALARSDVAAARAAVGRERHPILVAMGRALVAHEAGDEGAAAAALAELEARWADDAAYQIAQVHAYRGDGDAAFAWLARALEQGDPGLLELQADPYLAPLRTDPRYARLRERAGFRAPEERRRAQVPTPEAATVASTRPVSTTSVCTPGTSSFPACSG